MVVNSLQAGRDNKEAEIGSLAVPIAWHSGIGGQMDFMRGSALSAGGVPIIALPSTARDGKVSRIVPTFTTGTGVVTTRGDAHWIVTEFGAVN